MAEVAHTGRSQDDRRGFENGAVWLASRHALVRKMATGLWEVRIHLHRRIARILFSLVGHDMVLLHGFIKKSQETPQEDIELAKDRKSQL
jgi:phage-related protein